MPPPKRGAGPAPARNSSRCADWSRTPAARWPPPCSRLPEKVSPSMLCSGQAGARIEREQVTPPAASNAPAPSGLITLLARPALRGLRSFVAVAASETSPRRRARPSKKESLRPPPNGFSLRSLPLGLERSIKRNEVDRFSRNPGERLESEKSLFSQLLKSECGKPAESPFEAGARSGEPSWGSARAKKSLGRGSHEPAPPRARGGFLVILEILGEGEGRTMAHGKRTTKRLRWHGANKEAVFLKRADPALPESHFKKAVRLNGWKRKFSARCSSSRWTGETNRVVARRPFAFREKAGEWRSASLRVESVAQSSWPA